MVDARDVQDVNFDMCRFGHVLTNSLQVAQKVNRICLSWATSSKGNRHEGSRQRRAAVLCKAIPAGTEDQIREDQDETIVYSWGRIL